MFFFGCDDEKTENQEYIGTFTINQIFINGSLEGVECCTGTTSEGIDDLLKDYEEEFIDFTGSVCDTLWINNNLSYEHKRIQYSDTSTQELLTYGYWELWENNNESVIILDENSNFIINYNNDGEIILLENYACLPDLPLSTLTCTNEYIKVY